MIKLARAAVAAALASVMALPLPAEAIPIGSVPSYQGPARILEARCINCGPSWQWPNRRRWVARRVRPSFGIGIGAGILGFGIGLMIGRSMTNSNVWVVHVRRCSQRFHSYDSSTDMFLGFDGRWHVCRL